MPRIAAAGMGAGGANVCAFLDMLAFAEGTAGKGDDGYNVLVGGTLFNGYAGHPGRSMWLPRYKIHSTAAGRYQFLLRTWRVLEKQLKLIDFSPQSQDRGAMELIRGRGALDDVKAGYLVAAIAKCAKEWVSLPGADYGQREVALDELRAAYEAAGGEARK
jgi:muramidase (phage lysozyme)